MAVGTYFTAPGVQATLAERLQGSTWTIEPTPPISGVDVALLNGVSCTSSLACTAVGYTVTSWKNSRVRALAEEWDGTSWVIEPTPRPTGASWVTLAAVSCPTPQYCIAVGGYVKNPITGTELPLAEQWNGSTWSVLSTPNPHAENGSDLASIACVATDQCEAIGDYDYADIAQSIFAYSYDGSGWISQNQINPVGQEYNSDNSVSCTAASACTSVGSWTSVGLRGLAESYEGTSWSRQHLPRPARSRTDELNGVSCVASTSCTAVGDSANNLNGYNSSTMAEEWNGASWQLVPTPSPPSSASLLAGVSCTAAATCIAVGGSSTSSTEDTLVEKYSG
ncbi:MAG: hypothetical protein ACLQPH_16500 [Acidimicrobiales bacterium]